MINPKQEYQEELKKVQDKDVAHNWVSSSAFLFYLSIACIVMMSFGSCFKLYNKRFEKPDVSVPGNTLYTPVYK
jgi:hypothetical protein